MTKKNSISLVDGSGFIFRAYYALPSLTNKKGIPVGAVMGFCNMLFKLLEEKKSSKIIVIFDTARKTFRNSIYKNYKANRGDPPEDLIPQFELIRSAVDAFSISRLELSGYEADDLIASYSKFFAEKGWDISIISSDKDLMQLVGNEVHMLDPIKNKLIKRQEVIEKFGVPPEKVIDVQSLAGDSVDNIPGAPGIGLKTGALLINEYGSLESLLLNYSKIKQNKRRESIEKNLDAIKVSKKLVTLKDDIELNIDANKISDCKINIKKLIPFLEEQGFNVLKSRLLKKTDNISNHEKLLTNKKSNYFTIQDEKSLDSFIKKILQADVIALDTETNSIKPLEAKLIGISISYRIGEAFYIPINHNIKDKKKTA